MLNTISNTPDTAFIQRDAKASIQGQERVEAKD